MGVTGISQFKSGMQQAQQSVKTLDAELKLNEKQLQASGDKEAYMQQKSKLLQQQIAAQNKVVQQGQQALAAMAKNGVDPASSSYQKMQQQVLNAQTALLGMETDLQNVGAAAQATASQSDKMADSLNSINKKVSFDAVLGGIGKITDGMEAAARKVASLATNVWDTMLAGAAWADDLGTQAEMYGISTEQLQRMQKTAQIIQTPVSAIMTAKQKVEKNMHDMSADVVEAFEAMGLVVHGKFGEMALDMSKLTPGDTGFDFLFTIGDALSKIDDEILREVYAQKVLGMSWQTLVPLINKGKDAYLEVYNAQTVVSEENVDNLNELSSKVKDMQGEFETLKRTVQGELAQAFSTVAGSIAELLRQFNEYLQTDKGKEKLAELSDAVTNLFSGLTDVDFGQALDVAKGVLDGIVGALTWIKDNKDGVILAIKGIGGAFLVLKAAEVVGTLVKAADGLKTLLGRNGANTALNAANAADNARRIVQSGDDEETLVTGMPLLAKELTNPILWVADGVAVAYAMANKIKDAGGLGNFLSQAIPTSEDLERSANGLDLLISGKVRRGSLLHGIGITLPGGSTDTDNRIKNPSGRPIGRNKATVEVSDDFLAWAEQEHESPYEERQAKKAAQSMIEGIYGEIIRAVDEYDPRTNPEMNTSDYFDTVLYPKILQAAAMYGMNEDEAGGIADDFYNQWIDMWYSNWPGTSSDLVENMKKALDADGNGLQLPVDPTLPENAAQLLSDEIGAVKVPVDLVWPDGIDGSNANGLPFVPYDGYISLLHKGERIVPANQNKNYNVYNNTYFDRTQVSGGVDADGLAARIATAQKRALSAVGS